MNILNLLNKVQEFNSTMNWINLQKQSLWEIQTQISQTENILSTMKQNRDSIETNINWLEIEKSLIEPQVNMLYDLVKSEYNEVSNFDNTDVNYLEKISIESDLVQKLNTVEKILWKELTVAPVRMINSNP